MSAGARQFIDFLSPQEWIGLFLVLAVSLVLWSAEAAFVWRRLRHWLTGHPAPKSPSRRFRLAIHVACLLYAATFAYARFVEPEKLVLRRLTLTSEKIPAGVTLRIVQVSDVHAQTQQRQHVQRAADAVFSLQPDLVLLTGDFLCGYSSDILETLLLFLLRLPEVPALAVPGNYGGLFPPDPLLDQLGIETLHTERRFFTIKGVELEILGNSPTRRIQAVRRPEHPRRFGIFLEHFPALFPAAAEAGWDLYLAGHTHGGQIRIPWYGAVVTLDPAGKRFEWGAYRLARTIGYVNAGLGLECRGAPQIRLFCPPEILLIELSGTQK